MFRELGDCTGSNLSGILKLSGILEIATSAVIKNQCFCSVSTAQRPPGTPAEHEWLGRPDELQ